MKKNRHPSQFPDPKDEDELSAAINSTFNKELEIDVVDEDDNPEYEDMMDLTEADMMQLERAHMRLNIEVDEAVEEQDEDDLRKHIFQARIKVSSVSKLSLK